MADGKQFRIALTSWAAKFKGDLNTLARQTCQQISQNVVVDTPVDTGFLRASWQPSIGQPASKAEAGTGSLAAISAVASGVKAGDVYYMTNNAAYAKRIEFGFVGTDSLGRTYDQKGRFFVTRNVKRARTVVSNLVKELQA